MGRQGAPRLPPYGRTGSLPGPIVCWVRLRGAKCTPARSGWRPPSNGCGAPPFAIHKLLLERGSYPHTGRRELQLPIPHETGAPAPPTIRRRPPAKGAPDSSAPPAGWPDGPQPLLFGSTVAPKGPTADSHRVKGEEGYSPGTAIHEGQKAGMGPRAPHWMRNRPPPWGRGPTLAGRVALAGSMAGWAPAPLVWQHRGTPSPDGHLPIPPGCQRE